MASLLKPTPPSILEEPLSEGALEYYAKHTAQIEVNHQLISNLFIDVLESRRGRTPLQVLNRVTQ